MSKQHIKLDSFNDTFPENGSPISLTRVSDIIISDITLNNASIIVNLISNDISKNESFLLPNDKDKLVISHLYEPKVFTGLLFKLDSVFEGQCASFDLELVNL